jgi:DNA-directed RNA polymerase subunit H (RpoH/RPB5)
MSTSNSHIISIYKSRKNLLEILEERDFDITSYDNFSINEIGILVESNQLDMLLDNNTVNKKIYVKYYVNKVLKPQNIYDIVEDLFHLENILSKEDDLMIIIKDEPNDTLIQNVKDIWMAENIYISLVNIRRLQCNILKHELVPKHTILSKNEEEEIKKKFNILDNSQLPEISYFRQPSILLGFRPNDIIKIERKSRTSITSDYYRVCKI